MGQGKVKERKSVRAVTVGRKSVRSQLAEQAPPTPEATMHTDAQARKSGGRLSREDQRRLGDILQRVYDDVVRQGVPDRFKDLLNELDGSGHRSATTGGQGGSEAIASECDQAVGAKALGSKQGSH